MSDKYEIEKIESLERSLIDLSRLSIKLDKDYNIKQELSDEDIQKCINLISGVCYSVYYNLEEYRKVL